MARNKIADERLDFLRTEETLREKKRLQKQIYISIATTVYVVVIALFMVKSSFVSRVFTPNEKIEQKIVELEKQIDALKKQNEVLQNTISSQNPENFQYYNLNNRINSLENSQKTLSDAVLFDPNDAITARLLAEKQKNLDEQFDSLKESVQRTNDYLLNLFWLVILAPIIALIWSLVKSKFFKKSYNDIPF